MFLLLFLPRIVTGRPGEVTTAESTIENVFIQADLIPPQDRPFLAQIAPRSKVSSFLAPEITQEIQRVFGKDAYKITEIFVCESGMRPEAISPTGDYGIGQVNLKAHWNQISGETKEQKIQNLLNWEYNIAISKQIYDASKERTGDGFLPWVCYTKGIYK